MRIQRLVRREWMTVTFLAMTGTVTSIEGLSQTGSALLIFAILAVGVAMAFSRPVDMLGMLAVSVPVQAYGAVDVHGVSVTLTKLCVICLLIGWLSRVAAGTSVPIDSVVWSYVGVAVALGISIVATSGIMGWAAELYRWIVAAFTFVVARAEIRERHHVQRLLLGISGGVIGISTYAFQQVLTDDGPPSFMVNGLLRAYGTFGQPNPLAAYIEMSLPILVAMTVFPFVNRRKSGIPAVVQGTMAAAVVTGTVTIFLTQSRGGWIGIGAAGVVLVAGLPAKFQAAAAGGVVAALAALFILGWEGVVSDRLISVLTDSGERANVTPQNWANEERRAHWGAALNMVGANPWTGIGAGGFNDAYREYTSEWRFRVSRGHAHNGYLHMAAQAGIAGVVTFAVWIGSILLRLTRTWRQAADGRVVGGLATIVAFTVHSMVDYLNVLSLGIQFSLVIAIALATIPTGTEMVGEGTDKS